MNDLRIKAAIAGTLFAIWPLIMNRSGLVGNTSVTILTMVSLVITLPLTMQNLGTLSLTNWLIGIVAGMVSTLGLLLFNGILAKASSEKVGLLYTTTTLVQVLVLAVYQAIINGGVTVSKGIGFAAAAIAIVLLL